MWRRSNEEKSKTSTELLQLQHCLRCLLVGELGIMKAPPELIEVGAVANGLSAFQPSPSQP